MHVEVEFNRSWLFENGGLNSFAIKKVAAAFKDEYGADIQTVELGFAQASFDITSGKDASKLAVRLNAIISNVLSNNCDRENIYKLVIDNTLFQGANPQSGNQTRSDAASNAVDSAQASLLDRINREHSSTQSSSSAGVTPKYSDETSQASLTARATPDNPEAQYELQALEKIEALVGAQEFKTMCRNIAKQAPVVRQNRTQKVFLSNAMLFSIPRGSGFSCAAELLSELLAEEGILQEGFSVKEVPLPSPEDSDVTSRLEHQLDALDHFLKSPNLLALDISNWIGLTSSNDFKMTLLRLYKATGNCLIIFRVPFVEEHILEQVRSDINDILPIVPVTFHPFTKEELRELAKRQLNGYGFEMSADAWPLFDEKIELEAQDGYFYGIHTVTKIVNEMIRSTETLIASKKNEKTLITAGAVSALIPVPKTDDLSALSKLDSLVGMESVKRQIEEIVNQVLISRSNPSISQPCMHMRFVGNPGTGKTTVARILGEVMREKGILRIGKFFEHKARDLCGRYVGETAPKTTTICQNAYGSVLFIDEAYSLYRGDSLSNDYGREALDTLVTEMENHSNDLIVIMAGYPSDMEILMQGNAGLESRMPYLVQFPNYSREQLLEIFMRMASGTFHCDQSLAEAAETYFMALPDSFMREEGFGNARFVRNLFERVWGKAGMRCQEHESGIILSGEDFLSALHDMQLDKPVSAKAKIGFAQ